MRIVIAEDDALLREGLALLLRAEDLDVVATAGTPGEFLTAVDEHAPDVAIVDVRMPPTHTDEGIVAAVEARRRRPGLAVLVLSAYVEQAFATELFAVGAAGLGYLLKERVGRVEEFLAALHRVADGGSVIDPEVVGQLLARRRPDIGAERLSPREREVLGLMAEGLGNTAIAERLFVTDGAVHKHIRSIFAKLAAAAGRPGRPPGHRGAALPRRRPAVAPAVPRTGQSAGWPPFSHLNSVSGARSFTVQTRTRGHQNARVSGTDHRRRRPRRTPQPGLRDRPAPG